MSTRIGTSPWSWKCGLLRWTRWGDMFNTIESANGKWRRVVFGLYVRVLR